jgi:hypothetical protein
MLWSGSTHPGTGVNLEIYTQYRCTPLQLLDGRAVTTVPATAPRHSVAYARFACELIRA